MARNLARRLARNKVGADPGRGAYRRRVVRRLAAMLWCDRPLRRGLSHQPRLRGTWVGETKGEVCGSAPPGLAPSPMRHDPTRRAEKTRAVRQSTATASLVVPRARRSRAGVPRKFVCEVEFGAVEIRGEVEIGAVEIRAQVAIRGEVAPPHAARLRLDFAYEVARRATGELVPAVRSQTL